jgi:hypothetical protein
MTLNALNGLFDKFLPAGWKKGEMINYSRHWGQWIQDKNHYLIKTSL